MRDGSTPKKVKAGQVLVTSVTRPTANLGTLTGGAMLRMANGMRAEARPKDGTRSPSPSATRVTGIGSLMEVFLSRSRR